MIYFDYPTRAAATVSLIFSPAFVEITSRRPQPNQAFEVALGGQEYIRELSPDVELLIDTEIAALSTHGRDGYAGYLQLADFIQNTLRWHANTFELTEGTQAGVIVRYYSGFANLVESGGRNNPRIEAEHWFGSLTFRKTI